MARLHTLAAALGLALLIPGCGDKPGASTARLPADNVQRFTLAATEISDTKLVAATIVTRDTAEARTRIGGTLATLAVKEGDAVRRGQLIGRVVDQKLNFQTGAYDAQVIAAQAEAARTQAELARTRTLFDKGIYAKARLEQVEAAARSAQAGLTAARAQRSASAETSSQGAVLAPSDGRVLKAQTPAGSVVAPGQSIATLTSGKPVLRIEIPEAGGRALKAGDPVAIVAEDLPGVGPGTVTQVYPAIDNGRVVADVAAPGLRAEFIGQRARVRVALGARRALVAPARLIVTRYGVDYARIVGRDGQAIDIPVQITPGPAAGQVEVLSGLAAGDVILPPRTQP